MRLRRISCPVHAYRSEISVSLKLHAKQVPLGSRNACVPQSMRMPLGPSAQQIAGMPSACSFGLSPPNAPAVPGVTLGEHMPSPRTRAQSMFSSICATKSAMLIFPSATSDRRNPRLPVIGMLSGKCACTR